MGSHMIIEERKVSKAAVEERRMLVNATSVERWAISLMITRGRKTSVSTVGSGDI
ncbi:hypothetical protein A2U01_0082054, partial [Trifolium medium]|nr:hypothetical protein [Trifolium medium]